MFSEKQLTASSVPLVVDVSGRGISEVAQIPGGGREVAALTADNNKLVSLSGIHTFASLVQLSVCSNNLVDISRVSALSRLVTLNLQNNSITVIEGLESLAQLEWLGLAGNSIKVMSGLAKNTKLAHVDLSDNCITELGNISMLQNLKTLLLHGNAIKLLKSIPKCFPPSLSTLSLAENHVQDLNEVSFLSALPELREVSVMGNPCVSLTHHSMLFDYRPYVVYWCPRLSSLDGTPITAEEKLRSVSLFHSDASYPFQLGQHQPLVQYLMTACPLPILQNQLVSEGEKSPLVSLDSSSTHSLLSQAMSLENPQQKAEVLQKLRVLQVIEQMISEQENLLNSQHQQQQHKQQQQQQQQNEQQQTQHYTKPQRQQPTISSSTTSTTFSEDHSMVERGNGKLGNEESEANNSQTDTTLTTTFDTMEGEIIRPQPSQAFDVLDGASWSMRNSLQSVRMAWGGEEETSTGDEEKEEEEELGMGEREEGGERGGGETSEQGTGYDEPDFEMSISTYSTQCLPPSNRDSLTLLPRSHPTAETGTRYDNLGTETEKMKQHESADPQFTIEHYKLFEPQPRVTATSGDYDDKLCTKTTSIASLRSNSTATNELTQPSTISSVGRTSSTPVTVVSSWERMRREFSDIPLHTSSSAGLSSTTADSLTPAQSIADSDATIASSLSTLQGPPHSLQTTTQSLTEANSDATIVSATQAPGLSNRNNADSLTATQTIAKSSSDSTIVNALMPEQNLAEGNATIARSFSTVQGEARTSQTTEHSQAESIGDATVSVLTATQGLGGGNSIATVAGYISRLPHTLQTTTQCLAESNNVFDPTQVAATTSSSGASRVSPLTVSDPLLGRTAEINPLEVKYSSADPSTHHYLSSEDRGGGQEEVGVKEGEREVRVSSEVDGQPTSYHVLAAGSIRYREAGIHPQNLMAPGGGSMEGAVVKIQAWVRGVLSRRRVSRYKIRRQAAITIQSTWRGYRSRCCDPVVVATMRELSHKKMEAYISTMFLQLKGCREEMAHQAQVIQLQDETMSSLIQEVERLRKGQVEGDTLNRATSTIQKHWRQRQRVCDNQRELESLQVACSELRRQVKDLEKKVESLQEDYSPKPVSATFASVKSLPAPEKLSVSKHSSDTILLQWTMDSEGGSSKLLGYRVYVNGMEEGTVGPTKHRAYIEGLDASSTYRVSVRAVYDCGESEDSNTLLVAAVPPSPPGGTVKEELTSDGSRKDILMLPRSSEPPQPTELPVLVEKLSVLSKSSCSTLEAVSVEVSETHSMSLNLPTTSSLTGTGRDQMPTDQMGTSVDPPDQTSAHRDPSTNVDILPSRTDTTDPNPAHTLSAVEASSDLSSREDPCPHAHPLAGALCVHRDPSTNVDILPSLTDITCSNPSHSVSTVEASSGLSNRALAEDPGLHAHPLAGALSDNPKAATVQEAVGDLSGRYPPSEPTTTTTHTEHDRNDDSVPSAVSEQATTKSAPHRLEHSKHQQIQETSTEPHSPEKPRANDESSVCGKELASPLGAEAKKVLTGGRLCGQTVGVVTSVNEGVLQTETPPFAIEKPSHLLDTVGGRRVTHGDQQLTSTVTSPENTRNRTPSPVNPRSHRLAANFDANLSGSHPRNITIGMSQPPSLIGHLHQSNATELPISHPPTLQSHPPPTVSPTRHLQPNKFGHPVGQTLIPAPNELHSEGIAFSREEQRATDGQTLKTHPQKEGWGTSCQKEQRGMTEVGILGESFQQPLGKTGDVGHLSAASARCQPITQQGIDKHLTSSKFANHAADTGCLVGPPPANSDHVAPTPWMHPKPTPENL